MELQETQTNDYGFGIKSSLSLGPSCNPGNMHFDPLTYCEISYLVIVTHCLGIADTATDPKVKLQARAIANDCYRYIIDLCTKAGIVSDALKYVNGKTEKLSEVAKKEDDKMSSESESETESEIEREETTNEIF